jgi:5-methylcytosine-specific restriction protein A
MGWDPTRRSVPTTTRTRIIRRDHHTCQACAGTRCENQHLEIDHRIPHAEGGTDHDSNLWTLGARPCHAEKTDAERRRGIARKNPKRQPERHPGLR